ncbi:hypothetical protein POSPLADRAFT_1059578 [Postia placenta MAD-698-R-SB12]|uniref:Uncharacterized protein n=1 Tax=Postia placenta MAD-698-R-SB12 TaxID=670580 RepID=A0A1X6MT01_9APHY|nr:hypothetical protein POSPLADRAFT_1059578 [Postia placenta MAD-698-R-SB12]OSX59390.1 hypothetical protein POSPLADRAFT_1059578 [Postia placenta MAD-698-R-SB12]
MDVILLSSERLSPPQGQLQGFAEEGGGGETDGNPGTGTGGGLGRTLQMSAAADMGNIEEEHRGFQIEYATVHAR